MLEFVCFALTNLPPQQAAAFHAFVSGIYDCPGQHGVRPGLDTERPAAFVFVFESKNGLWLGD
jgi:hypothetical protein